MNYVTHNDKRIQSCGGSCLGEINANYSTLKKLFGKPTDSDGYKSDAEWEIEFEDGKSGYIYNWKDGKNYNGKSGTPKTKITEWHIGGVSKEVVTRIEFLVRTFEAK